jgi:NitT/TauT family transport system substrate-binding protein
MKTLRILPVVTMVLTAVLFATPQQSRADTTLEMAYMPIVPCSQLFVIEGMGWAKEAGINLELTRFSNGPAIVQAIASGKMDTMCFGIGPAMVTRGKGIKLKVIGAGIVEQIAVIAQGDLVGYFDKYPTSAAALEAFAKDKGRKPKIASFPKGSVPDTVTRHWILRSMGMSLDDVELIGMGASQVQQALLSRSVDAAGILEPILTIVESKLADAKVVVRANEMMPGQPGSTIAARENIIAEHRDALVKYMELVHGAAHQGDEASHRRAGEGGAPRGRFRLQGPRQGRHDPEVVGITVFEFQGEPRGYPGADCVHGRFPEEREDQDEGIDRRLVRPDDLRGCGEERRQVIFD